MSVKISRDKTLGGAPTLRRAAFAVFLLLSATAGSQGLPFSAASATNGNEEAPAPSLRNLEPDWWSYLTPAPQLPERVERMKAALQTDKDALPDETADAKVNEAVQRAMSLLDSYLSGTQQNDEQTSPAVRISGTFSPDELLELQARLAARQEGVRALEEELEATRELLKGERADYDQLQRRYFDSADEVERIVSGIDLVAARVELGIREIKSDKLENQSEQLSRYVQQLEAQFSYAQENTTGVLPPGMSRQNLSETIAQLEQQTADLAEQNDQVRQQLLTLNQSEDGGSLRYASLRQSLLSGMIARSSARIDQLRLKSRLALHAAHLQPGETHDFNRLLQDLRALLRDTTEEFGAWERLTEAYISERPAQTNALEKDPQLQEVRVKATQNLDAITGLYRQLSQLELLEQLVASKSRGDINGFPGFWSSAWTTAKDLTGDLDRWAQTSLFYVGDTPVTFASVVKLVAILLLTFTLSWLVRLSLKRMSNQRHIADAHSFYAVGRILHYVIFCAGLIVGLSVLGLDFTSLALIAGALSVGIGFGLQTTVNNFVSGLILLFDRTLKVGDFVELDSGLRGTVKDISVRATRINTNDNVDVVVPNSEFVSSRLVNWTMKDTFARLRIQFGVAYGSTFETIEEIALNATERVEYTLSHMPSYEPQLRLVGFGESSLDFELLVWVNRAGVRRPGRARAAYFRELEQGLREAGVEIPFPQRDLRIRDDGEAAQAARQLRLAVSS